MNKTKMIQIVNSTMNNQTIKSITEVVDKFLEVMTTSLKKKERVNFGGLIIDMAFVKGRSGVMFPNKIAFETQNRYVPRIKIGRVLKDKVTQYEEK